ncbi:MAG: NAD(P)/FAD-dependent oxidoreductase [Chitinispirillaceae bacterium]|nr:NAD(P)/FAD-dependent oxidoreductase [Chitinispirillaceae bacterium]
MPELLQNYALIVIGGGITGLSTAIAWAKNNQTDTRPVLVIEKESAAGGYVTSFKREGYLFDTVQIIPDSSDVLDYLGISIDLVKFDGYYARLLLADPESGSTRSLFIPPGVEAFKTYLTDRYLDDRNAIGRFFSYSRALFDELCYLKVEPSLPDILKILLKCPKIIANSKKTFKRYLDRFNFRNGELLEIFDVFAAFSGLPTKRVAALLPVSAMMTSLDGSYRPPGGFIEFPHRMKQQLLALGGHYLGKTSVERILVDRDRVQGVQVTDGRRFYADYVVTTVDPKVAMQRLLDPKTVRRLSPSYADKVAKTKMSASAFMINLGLDDAIDLSTFGYNCGYTLLTTGNGAFDRLYNAYEQGSALLSPKVFFVPVISPSLPTGRKNALTIFGYPHPAGDWPRLRETDYTGYSKRKAETADFYIDIVEKFSIPGLRKHIVARDIASPATFIRYNGSPTGSKFDMAAYPDNFGRYRLPMRTPVKNLFQPKFSHGIWPSLQAGLQVVDMIMGGTIMRGNSRYSR